MRILLIGTVRPSHEFLKQAGHELVLFMPKDKFIAADAGTAYQHTVLLAPDTPPQAWAALAVPLHAQAPFDAVACFTDVYQEIAHTVARQLGVFCQVDANVLARTSDKSRMRKALDEAGIAHCRYQFATGADAVSAAVYNIGLPCILKPVAGQASQGVVKVSAPEQLAAALQWVGADALAHGVIVEEFMQGPEFSVEGITVAGRHHLIAVTQKYKDPQTFVEIGHLVPAQISAADHAAIIAYVSDVLTALGFESGPSHTELILTERGPRIVETHTRLGGDRIIHLVEHATGVNLYALSANQSTGADISADLPTHIPDLCSAAIWYACPELPSQVQLAEVRNVAEAAALPGVKSIELLKEPGSLGSAVRHSHDRSALAIAVADEGGMAVQRAKEAIAVLHFTYQWLA